MPETHQVSAKLKAEVLERPLVNRGFPKIEHPGIDSRIVLGQNEFSKKATSNRTWTLNPMTVVFPVPCLSNCANTYGLKDWDFNHPYKVMFYWFQLNPLSSFLSPKVNWCTNQSWVIDPRINTHTENTMVSVCHVAIRGFTKIDNSGIDARIELEQNKFSKNVSSNRNCTLNPRTVVLTSCVQFHALPTELSEASVNSGIYNSTLVRASINFGT